MDALIKLSRTVAAHLAAEFRDDPRGELAAWLHIALEREGMVASLYDRHCVESRLQSLPKRFVRSALAKVNGICASEEAHVSVIRALVAADCAWPQVAFEEGWGRLQGFVLSQLTGTNPLARAIALILLELGARSGRERAAGRAVAGLNAGGFLKFSRTLEITAVESYQRVVALLATLRSPKRRLPSSIALDLKILGILRDERVHRDVFHVLHRAFGGDANRVRRADDSRVTELPDSITTRPIAGRADLNEVCRAILTFHYGAALPSGAPPEEAIRTAVAYWRWQIENPLRKSYLVECQRQDVLLPEGDILLLGTAGLEHVVRGIPSIRSHRVDRRLIPWFMAQGESRTRRRNRSVRGGPRNNNADKDGPDRQASERRGQGSGRRRAVASPPELHHRPDGVGSRADVPPE